MTLAELRQKLSALVENCDPNEHEFAEQLLLQYINDPEVSRLWAEGQEFWWYA
jgi:hypothetical protein